jgi:glycosyltransferase involved in cell wall biosynthesis
MRIGIDARLYAQTGVGRYLQNIISELSSLDQKNDYIVYLRKEEFGKFIPPNNRWRKKILDIKWHTLKEQLHIPYKFLKDNLDIAHFPYFNVPILYPKKYLLTVHDLIIDHFDTGKSSTLSPIIYKIKRLGYKFSLKLGMKRASAIAAISKTTKKEVMSHYQVPSDRIIITYDALDKDFNKIIEKQKVINYYSFPYILYVGNAYPHKNLDRLIHAFKIIKKRKLDLRLILAGDDSFFYPRLKKLVKRLNLEKDVIFFGNAHNSQLVNLYSNASCLVFPSLMEGFGLPNLEALACAKLPVVSDIPVFREIWGDIIIYFNPYDEGDIARKIIKALCLKPEEYQKRIKAGQKRINDFSWKKTAQETLKIYNKIYYS